MQVLQLVLTAVCLLLAAVVAGHVVVGRFPGRWLFVVLAALEVALVAQLVVGVVLLATTDADVAGVTYVGYLVGTLLVVPAAVGWAQAERSRSGTAVLLVGLLVVPVLIVRLQQVWAGDGG